MTVSRWENLPNFEPADPTPLAIAHSFAEILGEPADSPRIRKLYAPLFFWIDRLREESDATTLVIGLNGPQGGGKTTLTRALVSVFERVGVPCVSLSIDDFYLTRAQQIEVAAAGNPLLQMRGYPGTHDVGLGTRTLKALKTGASPLLLPSYDKGAHQGRGDRKPESEWLKLTQPASIVLIEGWMLGFRSLGQRDEIDENLRAYEEWTRALDALIWLEPQDVRFVLRWRVEAEAKMRASTGRGMSDEEAAAYIAPFVSAYETYLPGLSLGAPISGRAMRVLIGADRLPVDAPSS